VNPCVIEELIDWSKAPEDPIFQLTFWPHRFATDEDADERIDLLARLAAAGWLRSLPGPMRSR
jgi:hypothetical protein